MSKDHNYYFKTFFQKALMFLLEPKTLLNHSLEPVKSVNNILFTDTINILSLPSSTQKMV